MAIPGFINIPFLAEGPSVPIAAPSFANHDSFLHFFTNTTFFSAIVCIVILLLSRRTSAGMRFVPARVQNVFEFILDVLYRQIEGIVGPKVAPKCFPLLATMFIFILLSNWMGLLPGVGTLGYGHANVHGVPFWVDHVSTPLLRPGTSDLNLTLGLAVAFMIMWTYLTIREVGVGGFLKHTFGSKGGLTGIMGVIMAIIFFFVGLIEIVSILSRPVSLSLRLFGNVYAGETLLHEMSTLGSGLGAVGGFIASVIFPLPFFFMELLVGLLQAGVFVILCAVYIKLSTEHEEHPETDAHGKAAH